MTNTKTTPTWLTDRERRQIHAALDLSASIQDGFGKGPGDRLRELGQFVLGDLEPEN